MTSLCEGQALTAQILLPVLWPGAYTPFWSAESTGLGLTCLPYTAATSYDLPHTAVQAVERIGELESAAAALAQGEVRAQKTISVVSPSTLSRM